MLLGLTFIEPFYVLDGFQAFCLLSFLITSPPHYNLTRWEGATLTCFSPNQ